MKFTCPIALLVLSTLAATGCSKNENAAPRANDAPAAADRGVPAAASPKPGDVDGIVAAYVSDMELLSSQFKLVQDEASAKKHAPKITATAARLQGYGDQLQAVEPTKRGMAFAAHVQRFMQIQQEMTPELTRISNDPALAKYLGDALKVPKVN